MTKRQSNKTPPVAPTAEPITVSRVPLFRFADLERKPAELGAHQTIHGAD